MLRGSLEERDGRMKKRRESLAEKEPLRRRENKGGRVG